MNYSATIQIICFVPVSVDAASKEEAESKVRSHAESYISGPIESPVFETFETELKPDTEE